MICISCKTEYEANFCSNCGEKSGTKKITLKSIIEDALSTVTYMDKGFFYNIKMLALNPKKISIDYILGKRKGILNPISFLIFSVTMYLVVENLLRIPKESIETQDLPKIYIGKVAYAIGRYLHSYFKYFWILSIIPLAISTKLFFRKYNLMEHITINSFIVGQATLIGIISYIILKIDMVVNPLVYLSILWLVYRIFIIKKDKLILFLMSSGVLALFIIQLLIIAIGIGVIMV